MHNAPASKPAAGFDARLAFRVPSDLGPAIHAHARRRGLTSASWVRMIILDALGHAAPDAAQDHPQAA